MITVKLQGGLGNQMFQYACALNLARRKGTGVALDLSFLNFRPPQPDYVLRDYDLDIFLAKPRFTALSRVPKRCRNLAPGVNRRLLRLREAWSPGYLVAEKNARWFQFDAQVLEAPKRCYLDGYWQNIHYFKGCEDELRARFTAFQWGLGDASREMLKRIQDSRAVCLNFRRTDYVEHESSKKHHGSLGDDYYGAATKLLSEKFPNPHFFVFSDDIAWCEANFKSEFPVTFVRQDCRGEKFSDYLRLMTACRHYIIPNSSFAWWAAWLSPAPGKIVISPRRWVLDPAVNTDGLIPPDWIRL